MMLIAGIDADKYSLTAINGNSMLRRLNPTETAMTVTINPPRRVTGSLGPNQLEWCRVNLRGFRAMEQQALRAREERRCREVVVVKRPEIAVTPSAPAAS